MSNRDEQGYFRCNAVARQEKMAVESYQGPFTSTASNGGYSSGSDSDDTDATNISSNQVAEHLSKNHQQMYIYNREHQKWHECELSLRPSQLQMKEYTDTKIQIQEDQLQHVHKRWFHGDISRREARYILQDYNGGEGSFLVRTSESYRGKYAISFVHEERVKHVVIETKPSSETGVVYHITPKGPFFDSLNGLIEEARNTYIIQNHSFNVILKKSPPKPDQKWLHTNIKTLSQAQQVMGKPAYSSDGSFLVYPNNSPVSPYSLVYRSNGVVIHADILTSQRSSHGYTLNTVTAPVLYKLINYFMENPIHANTVLQNASQDSDCLTNSNSAIALEDFTGDCDKNEQSVYCGELITSISRRSLDWCVGDFGRNKQKFFPTKCVRFLSKDELQYIKDVKEFYQKSCTDNIKTHTLNVRTDYMLSLESNGSSSPVINLVPVNQSLTSYKLSCNDSTSIEQWYKELDRSSHKPSKSLSTGSLHSTINNMNGRKLNSNTTRRKRTSCVVS